MKHIIIPDVHGRIFWEKAIKQKSSDDIVIFLGDYLDPYPNENISKEDTLFNFIKIINLKKSDPEHYILLLGNHDLGYLWGEYFCSSRHWYEKHEELHQLYQDNHDLFDLFYQYNNIIFSHAGVHPRWLEQNDINWDSIELINKMFHNCQQMIDYKWVKNVMYYIDLWRGGFSNIGSPVWADIRCFINNSEDVDKYIQYFGHTQLANKPIRVKTCHCLDCRRAFILQEDMSLTELDGSKVQFVDC